MTEIEVNELGLVGKFYLRSKTGRKKPGIILLSGSDGGIPGANAIPLQFIETLVDNGFAVLALAYFGLTGLPSNLESIDLEYFEQAVHWLQARSEINKDAIAIIGQSRGAELALILGTMFHQLRAIVAFAPSNRVMGGFPYPNRPAWQYKGHVIQPFLGGLTAKSEQLTELEELTNAAERGLISKHENPYIISDLFAARNKMEGSAQCEIPVEKIACPILLFSGGQDAIWPSQHYCEAIINRLKQYAMYDSYHYINYEEAGHGLIGGFAGSIYHPVGQFWCQLGGTADGNQAACQNSVQTLLAFLRKPPQVLRQQASLPAS